MPRTPQPATVQPPATKRQVNVLLSPEVWDALQGAARTRGERPTETMRRIVVDALMASGDLERQHDPEPFRRPFLAA